MEALRDIFDEIGDEEEDVFSSVESEDTAVDNLKKQLTVVLNKFDDKERKKERELIKAEFEKTLKEEIAKIKPVQNVIEKTIQTRVIEPKFLEPKVIQAPPPPPQIIREVRVEVEKKDNKKYVEESKYLDLLVKISKLENQLKEVKRMAESPIVTGGPGVIGIPPPEPETEGHVLTVKTQGGQKKALWQAATGGTGGLTAGTYSVSNATTDRTFDADDTSLDELADVVATLISDLGGL